MELFELTKIQSVILSSIMISILAQMTFLYYVSINKYTFNLYYAAGYFIFSIIAYLFYYKLLL